MLKFISNKSDLFSDEEIKESSLEELVDWLKNVQWFACDTETQGFLDFSNRVIMLQIGNKEVQFVVDTRGLDVSCLSSFFSNSNILKIFHNAKFDVNMLRFSFGFITENVYDTFLAEACLTNGIEDRKLGLDSLVAKYTGNYMSKHVRGSIYKMGDKPFTHDQIKYGAMDVALLPDILQAQLAEIEKWSLQEVVALENQTVLAVADIEYTGMKLDPTKWLELADIAKDKAIKFEQELDAMVVDIPKLKGYVNKYVQQGLFGETGRRVSIQWSSPTQMLKVFKTLGLSIESSGEKEITKFQNTYPIVKKFIDYKKEDKLTSTYGKSFLKFINPNTGRIHTSFWQILDTHRISSSDPNLQQIPAKKEYYSCFVAPDGYKIVGADFSGQELRLIAEGSKDPVWLDVFNNGKDLHGEIAAKIFGVDITKVKEKPEFVFVGSTKVYLRGKSPRDVTKTINFMLAYGGSKFKLSDTLGITVDEAGVIIEEYFRLVPRVATFLESLAKYGVRNGYIRSYKPYSIVRQFSNFDRTDDKKVGSVQRMSKNTPIQGTGAMMCKKALVDLREEIKKTDGKVEMFLQVHDAIFCYVREEYAEEWAKIQKEVMEEAGRIWIKSIPVISDTSISDVWSK